MIRNCRPFVPTILAAGLCFALMVIVTGVNADAQNVKRVPVKPTAKDSGAEMYKVYCATCHGMDGKGNGPAAAAMKTPPTDLTLLSKNNGGKFPELKFQNVLKLSSPLAAHGSSEMPMWGPIFRSLESGSEGYVQMRIYNLMKHVEGMQVK